MPTYTDVRDDKANDRKWCEKHCSSWHRHRKICGHLYTAYLEGYDCHFSNEEKKEITMEYERNKVANKK